MQHTNILVSDVHEICFQREIERSKNGWKKPPMEEKGKEKEFSSVSFILRWEKSSVERGFVCWVQTQYKPELCSLPLNMLKDWSQDQSIILGGSVAQWIVHWTSRVSFFQTQLSRAHIPSLNHPLFGVQILLYYQCCMTNCPQNLMLKATVSIYLYYHIVSVGLDFGSGLGGWFWLRVSFTQWQSRC